MTRRINRRTFTQTVALGLGAAALPVWAQGRKNLKIGHTGITWPSGQGGRRAGPPPTAAPAAGRAAEPGLTPPPAGPRPISADAIENIFKDVSSLGFAAL